MKKETKYFLKETEDDDSFKKGDPIKYKKLTGTVLEVSHYIITAEMIEYSWKEKIKGWFKNEPIA